MPSNANRQRFVLATIASALWAPAMAVAQADGPPVAPVVIPVPKPAPLAFANKGPGGALMNNLNDRMKEIQATPDPVLRQRRMDEFLKTLQQGMANISKQPVAGASR